MTSILYDNEEQDRLLERIGHAINANNGRCSLAEEVLSECSTLVTAIMENRKAWGLDKPVEAKQDWPDGSSHLAPQLGLHEDGSFTMHPEAWKAFASFMGYSHLIYSQTVHKEKIYNLREALRIYNDTDFAEIIQ